MNIIEIIEKKKQKKILTEQEIDFFVKGAVNKTISDYQTTSLLMAIVLNGMNNQETSDLTKAMLNSGKTYDFINKKDIVIDKHSSGGVGDKVSIILIPICIALGLKVAKMSGRGLGHTGGTIDKLEAINVNTSLNYQQQKNILNKVGGFIAQQTDDIVPADKVIYALRNDSGTVDSIPLIASSIVSKKLALKKDYTFLDVKVGSGAFMQTLEDAKKLSSVMRDIFTSLKQKVVIHITDMNQPLGRAIGNAIEIKETIDFLKGSSNIDDSLKSLIYDFVSDILITIKKAKNKNEAFSKIDEVINNRSALNKLYDWVKTQNGDINKVKQDSYFKPKYIKEINSNHEGYIRYKSSKEVGMVSFLLGAGRMTKKDPIDMQAGVYLNKVINEFVSKNETIATLYSSKPISNELIKRFLNNVEYSKNKFKHNKMILCTLSNVK
jgi:pyrimidine-nucleoside phosphorylase